MRGSAAGWIAIGACSLTACEPPPPRSLDRADLAALEAEIDSLAAVLASREEGDSLFAWIQREPGDVVLGTRTALVQEIAGWAAERYLDDVRLHLRPDAVVEEGEEVRTKVGPISVRAGEWRLRLTIRSIDALLSADSIRLAVADSSSLSAMVRVGVSEARGTAALDFEWDAGGVGSVVCRDFELEDTFGGRVPPTVYQLEGRFVFGATPQGIVANPEFPSPVIRVRPEPDPAAWERVNQFLDDQNHVLRCGIALKPDDVVEQLRALLAEGFDVTLPGVLFRPITLPARIDDQVEVENETLEVINTPVHLHLTEDAIWYGSRLRLQLDPAESAGTVESAGSATSTN